MKLAKQRIWGMLLCLFGSACSHEHAPTIMGKWQAAGTWHAEKGMIPVSKEHGNLVHDYKPDSTWDVYMNGKLSLKNQPFSINRGKHPDGSGKPVDFLITPDGQVMEKNQLVWIKGEANDTLVFMLLDAERSYKPYVYSVYTRLTK